MRYALIKNGTVRNVIDATPDMAARIGHYTVVQTDDPAVVVGSTYDGAVFGPPVVKKPAVLSRNDFLDLFTQTELEDMLDVDMLPAPAKRPARVVVKRLEVAGDTIDLNSPRVIELVTSLETLGIIGAGRAAEILAGGV